MRGKWRYVIGAFVLFVIISNPTGASATASGLLGWLEDAATSVSTFLTSLF